MVAPTTSHGHAKKDEPVKDDSKADAKTTAHADSKASDADDKTTTKASKGKKEPPIEGEEHRYKNARAAIEAVIAETEKALESARERIGVADEETRHWEALSSKPGIPGTTQAAHVQPHRDYWRNESKGARERTAKAESDLAGLKLLRDAVVEPKPA